MSATQPRTCADVFARLLALFGSGGSPLGTNVIDTRVVGGRRVAVVEFHDWLVRISVEPRPHDVVELRAELRPTKPLPQLRALLASPLQAGWSPFFAREVADPKRTAAALEGIAAELAWQPGVNAHLHRHVWQ